MYDDKTSMQERGSVSFVPRSINLFWEKQRELWQEIDSVGRID